jgi:hypothetical protein
MGVRLKRLKMVSTYIWVDTIASSDGVRKVCCPDGYPAGVWKVSSPDAYVELPNCRTRCIGGVLRGEAKLPTIGF